MIPARHEEKVCAGRKITVFLLCLLISSINALVAQPPTDCVNTLAVCSNGSINQSSNGAGINDFAAPGSSPGCLVTNEHQSVWLYIQIESGSNLGFDIIPTIPGEDYDFAVYGPNVTCDNLGTPVRCSYAAPFGSSSTGMNGSNSDLTEGANGNGYVRWLNVTPGQSYFVLVDNFSASFQGFTLNWTGDGILDCSVTQPCPEVDLGPNTSICDGSPKQIGGPTGPTDQYLWNTGATTSIITVSDSGTYWMEATRNGCTVRDSIYVGLAETPSVFIGADTLLCDGDSVTLDATNPLGTSYEWQDGSTGPQYTVTSPGTYTVSVYNNGCRGADAITVNFEEVPEVDLGPDTTLCGNTNLLVNSQTPTASIYTWQDGSPGPVYNVTESGTYYVTASNGTCTGTDTLEVSFGNTPNFNLGSDTALCDGQLLTLNAYAPNGLTYLWNDGSTAPSLDVASTGTYGVLVTNDDCSMADSIEVNFLAYPEFDLGPDTVICDGSDLVLDAASTPATAYTWQDGSTASSYDVVVEGSYYVAVSNDFCTVRDTISVLFNSFPSFSLGPDTLLCRGTVYPVSIDGEPDYKYTWSDNSEGPSIEITERGSYYVVVENQCGTRYDTLVVEYGSCNCDFFFPTGFTPNGDGLNDFFVPIMDCDSLQNFRFEIFNRWGEQVHATDNPVDGWNAANQFEALELDAYIWIIEYGWSWRGQPMTRRENGYFSIIK